MEKSGEVRCWGDNSRGALGDGHAEQEGQEQQISPNLPAVGLSIATAIASGNGSTVCAVLADATVRCWGENDDGLVGDGTDVTRFAPVMPVF